jgi:cell division cycle 2-like protein
MDLRDAVEQDPDSPFSQAQMKSMLHQILSAVEHTHACWYMHRDIKPSNFLVTRGQLKLCDFGLARKYHDPLLMYTQPVITLWYRPPELLFGETVYGPKVDMWRHVSSSSTRTLIF